MKPIWEFISEADWLRHVDAALQEDLGQGDDYGDHSSLACFSPDAQGLGTLRAKASGVVAGLSLIPSLWRHIDPRIQWVPSVEDGARVHAGTVLGTARGSVLTLLKAERTLLNYVQRLSGIATQTQAYVSLVEGTGVVLLDTRKTTPGWRALEKWAVQVGGGSNHRMGLYDYVMLKDNHIDAVGSLTEAVKRTELYLQTKRLKRGIEVEVRTLTEVDEALQVPAITRIMLDNFSPEACRQAVATVAGRLETEASGGITAESLRAYAESGVTFISIGALTHSVKSVDIHFKVQPL